MKKFIIFVFVFMISCSTVNKNGRVYEKDDTKIKVKTEKDRGYIYAEKRF